MSFKFSTNFLLPYVRKPAKYGGRGSIGLDATPTVLIHICHPVGFNIVGLFVASTYAPGVPFHQVEGFFTDPDFLLMSTLDIM